MKKIFLVCMIIPIVFSFCRKDVVISSQKSVLPENPVKNDTVYNISYFDWVPDVSFTDGSNLYIDVDLDNKNDLVIYLTRDYAGSTPSGGPYYNYFTYIATLDTNIFISCGYLSKINTRTNILFNNLINDSLYWTSDEKLFASGIWVSGSGWWDKLKNDGLVGVKITSSAGNKYGWVKIKQPNSYNISIMDQALNNNYNQFLRAGQTH